VEAIAPLRIHTLRWESQEDGSLLHRASETALAECEGQICTTSRLHTHS
jgi:hypothetical protein